MAIIAQEVWSDLHHDIKVDAQGSIKKVINIESVKTSIDNILRTAKGTRVMIRSFGSDIKMMLFENIDGSLSDVLADEIKETINIWDDRVIVNEINFDVDPDRNSVIVGIHFSVRGYDRIFSMSSVI